MTKLTAPSVRSFTSLWEYECCGDPLHVGDETTVSHIAHGPDEVFSPLTTLDWYVGHHALDDSFVASRVRVVAVWEAYSALAYHDGPDGYYAPKAGTGRLVPVEAMTPRRPEWRYDFPEPPADFVPAEPQGWVMELEVLPD